MPTVAIIGLGYVGLPLALQFARSGIKTIGIDIDLSKIESLKAGKNYIQHLDASDLFALLQSGHFAVDTDPARITDCDSVILCLPTPLNKNREPDLSYVLNTAQTLAPHLQKGTLLVLESTTYPGTTENELRNTLEKGSTLTAGFDFHLAFSPEREDPGNMENHLSAIPKVVGGLTPACLDRACSLYTHVVKEVVPVSSCRVAEATKLLENIFRSVNIALVNELKQVYAKLDIDIWEVIEAAKTKPFGFMPFYPGPGLGGHCIPIDPFYLAWKAREVDQPTRFIELAGEINTAMPAYVIEQVAKALNQLGKAIKNSKILVLGLAYKPDVDDDRESASYILMDLLREWDAQISYYDPHIPTIRPGRHQSHWAQLASVTWNRETLTTFDAVLIATAHSSINYTQLAEWSDCIIDTRNAMANIETTNHQVWKA